MPLRTLLTRSLAPALCALGVAACGGSQPAPASTTTTTRPSSTARAADTHTLFIYSSLPHNGPQRAKSRQVEQGIDFELKWATDHHQMAGYQVKYRALSDSTPPRRRRHGKVKVLPSRGWNANATVQRAQQAARNPQTVAYVGDLDSGATELSLPILNQAGIVQLTPGSGYPGLSARTGGGGSSSLLRLVPDDTAEAQALVYWLKKKTPCTTAAAAAFGGEAESTAMVEAIETAAKNYKLGFVPVSPPAKGTKAFEAYFAALHNDRVNCFVLTGHVTRAAVAFTTQLEANLPPGSWIVGTNGLCNPGWTDPARGGVPARVDASLYCMSPVLPLADYPHGKRFSGRFRTATHHAPTAYTYYGYLAASLVLQAIRQVGGLDARRTVMSNLVDNSASADLDTYTFEPNGDLSGDPSANYYRLERVVHGVPTPYKVVEP